MAKSSLGPYVSHHPFSDLLDFLGDTQIFQGLSQEQLASVAQLARLQRYDKDEMIFQQGDEGKGFFIVRSGRVKVFQVGGNGREQILHVFNPGAHFAEVPAFDGNHFPASAAALEKTEVLFFPRQFFLDLLAKNPDLTVNLLKSFARHLRRFSNLVDNLALRGVPERLAVYLLSVSYRYEGLLEIELDLSKRQLAAMLGTVPETLSRTLLKLSQERTILVEGSRIKLLNLERLRQLAE